MWDRLKINSSAHVHGNERTCQQEQHGFVFRIIVSDNLNYAAPPQRGERFIQERDFDDNSRQQDHIIVDFGCLMKIQKTANLSFKAQLDMLMHQ